MTNTDAAGLAQLVAEGRFRFLELAQCLLGAPALVAGWNARTVEQAAECKDQGGRLELAISADASGAARVALVAIARDGERVEIGHVAEHARSAAN